MTPQEKNELAEVLKDIGETIRANTSQAMWKYCPEEFAVLSSLANILMCRAAQIVHGEPINIGRENANS